MLLTVEILVVLIRHAVYTRFGGDKVRVVPAGNCSRTPWMLKVILFLYMVENCVTQKIFLSRLGTIKIFEDARVVGCLNH